MCPNGSCGGGPENKLIQLNLGVSHPIFSRLAPRADRGLFVSRETRRGDRGLKPS